jgi:hypothetical protein
VKSRSTQNRKTNKEKGETKMKKFIATIAALVLFVGVAQAQQYSTTSVSVTNLIAAVSTNTVDTGAFTATKYGEVVVQVSAKLTAAGTTVTLFTIQKGVDGTTYDSPTFTLPLTQTGTTTASASTNVNMGAYGYVRIKSIGNGDDDGVCTNIVVKYTVKPNRQDGK